MNGTAAGAGSAGFPKEIGAAGLTGTCCGAAIADPNDDPKRPPGADTTGAALEMFPKIEVVFCWVNGVEAEPTLNVMSASFGAPNANGFGSDLAGFGGVFVSATATEGSVN